ncbi:hypothetical protein [Marinimicrococcus flavescens]|uniref:Uncharacterized protein n=1 Tax=Marinimicrococcus flavescens TaxID=3031815 RepID=A0AAP3UXI7_9PROT|nr:hypothetical protein [Marinimicrococcus flavescens]
MSDTNAPATDAAATPDAPPRAKTNLSPEDQAAFSALLTDLTRRHAPEGAVEEHWVGQMAMAMLRGRWADALEQRVVEAALAGEACKGLPASVLPRWRTRLEKDFRQAARELEASKAERRATAPGLAPSMPLTSLDARMAAFEADLARDPQAALASLLAAPDPFADDGTNEPDAFLAHSAPRGTNEPDPPLNRAQRHRLATAGRTA